MLILTNINIYAYGGAIPMRSRNRPPGYKNDKKYDVPEAELFRGLRNFLIGCTVGGGLVSGSAFYWVSQTPDNVPTIEELSQQCALLPGVREIDPHFAPHEMAEEIRSIVAKLDKLDAGPGIKIDIINEKGDHVTITFPTSKWRQCSGELTVRAKKYELKAEQEDSAVLAWITTPTSLLTALGAIRANRSLQGIRQKQRQGLGLGL